jgi:dipeptidase
MDYLRLALERAASAREALEVIVSLLAVYGQSGNCGFTHPLYYHNSFLIADTQEAWVLETVDHHWAAQKVKDVRSISNGLTIEHDFDLASEDLVSFAVQKGWCRDEDGFSFKDCYSDVLMTFGSDAKKRQCRPSELLHENKGKMDVPIVMQIL